MFASNSFRVAASKLGRARLGEGRMPVNTSNFWELKQDKMCPRCPCRCPVAMLMYQSKEPADVFWHWMVIECSTSIGRIRAQAKSLNAMQGSLHKIVVANFSELAVEARFSTAI